MVITPRKTVFIYGHVSDMGFQRFQRFRRNVFCQHRLLNSKFPRVSPAANTSTVYVAVRKLDLE